MEHQEELHCSPEKFTDNLLSWYSKHGRKNLPWSQTQNPYAVWVSEIMLQQTQVSTVIPYFENFILKFPSVAALADADLDEVLRFWKGLGYYARARNLHKAAQVIQDDFGGQFPQSVGELTELPGVGRSTAGAICALAFNQREPILDGNAKRVYARIFTVDGKSESIRTKTLWSLAQELTPESNCARYTQAIMDLGATICLPRSPLCNQCPMTEMCKAWQVGSQEDYPIRKETRKNKTRSVTMVMVRDCDARILLERRPAKGIWGGLWSFPEYEKSKENLGDWFHRIYRFGITPEPTWPSFEHQFTHLRLTITPLPGTANQLPEDLSENLQFLGIEAALQVGTPKPVTDLLEQLKAKLET